MSGTTHFFHLGGVVTLPENAELHGSLVAIDGRQYMLGPALYAVEPSPPHPTILGEAATGAPSYNLTYCGYESWPPGFELDNAVTMDLSQPLGTEYF